jgi:hypothetical protein
MKKKKHACRGSIVLTEGLVKHIEALPDGVVMRLGEALQQQQRQHLYSCTIKASKLSPCCHEPKNKSASGFINALVVASQLRYSSELSTCCHEPKNKSANGC